MYRIANLALRSKWSYFTGQDPTNGKVDYLSLSNAKKAGLVSTSGDTFIMGVETGDLASGTDRKSYVDLLV